MLKMVQISILAKRIRYSWIFSVLSTVENLGQSVCCWNTCRLHL